MIFLGRKSFRYLFTFICNVGVMLMIGYWLYKFVIEDRDVGVVDYELMEKAKDVEYPVPAFCFRNPFVKKKLYAYGPYVNSSAYVNYLKGDLFNHELVSIDYENVTLSLDDYFEFAEVRLSNESRLNKRNVTLKFDAIFNGLYKLGSFFKCFSASLDKNYFPNIREIKFNFNKYKLLKDLIILVAGSNYEVAVGIHYPGQFLSAIGKPLNVILRDHNYRKSIVAISGIELLKRRKKSDHDCSINWKSFDGMVLKKHIETIGCRAPYQLEYKNYPLCNNQEDIKRSTYKYSEVRRIYYPKSCWRLSKLDYARVPRNIRQSRYYWTLNVQYPEEVKIVTQSKEIDEHALVGNIGGYFGLFLGKVFFEVIQFF